MKERERPLEQILHQYITYVKPAFEEFCLPVSVSQTTTLVNTKPKLPRSVIVCRAFLIICEASCYDLCITVESDVKMMVCFGSGLDTLHVWKDVGL